MPTQTAGLQQHSITTVMGRGPQLQSFKSVIIYLGDILTCPGTKVSIKTSYTACTFALYVLVMQGFRVMSYGISWHTHEFRGVVNS